MKIANHAIIAITIGSIIYSYTHSWMAFLGFSFANILVDLDHYIDYIREHRFTFNIKKVHDVCLYPTNFEKLILIMHSYELIILMWVAILLFRSNFMWRYIIMGISLHILIDQMTNPILPQTYFFLFRIKNGFKRNRILEGDIDYARWNR